jgi:hypothetical protein
MCVVKNKHSFTKNWEIHSHNTRTTNNLHIPAVNTTKYKKGSYYMSSKIFSQLPNYIKNTANNEKTFKKVLHTFLIDNAFYSIDEYLTSNKQTR